VQPTFGPSHGALKYPGMQGQVAAATPLWSVLAGHCRQGTPRSKLYIPEGQADQGEETFER